ncbi:MAG: hypothetical protein ACRERZ_03775, partial [Gammaproteobacteria bacterium]
MDETAGHCRRRASGRLYAQHALFARKLFLFEDRCIFEEDRATVRVNVHAGCIFVMGFSKTREDYFAMSIAMTAM